MGGVPIMCQTSSYAKGDEDAVVSTFKFLILCGFFYVCVLSCFSYIQLFMTPWTIVHQAGSPVHGILQARILKWVAMHSLKGIFLTQGSNQCLLHLLHWQAGSLQLEPVWKPYLS